MSENQSLLRICDGRLVWLEPGRGEAQEVSEPAVRARLDGVLAQRNHHVVFAAPGADLRLLEIPVSREERRHLQQALPFMLEDRLSEDIEDLHFARCALERDQLAVAILRHDCMGQWDALLGEWATQLPWVPEPLLVPRAEGEWTLVLEPVQALVRFSDGGGAALEREHLPMLLEALAEEAPPERIVIYADEEPGPELAPFGDRVEWRRGGLGEALLLGERRAPQLNLRQGAYAPQLPYAQWWARWRAIAALLVVAVFLQGLSSWLDMRRLDRENLVLRQEIEGLYRQLNPRGNAPDVERQLRRQLASLQGGSSGGSFNALLAPLGAAVSAGNDLRLANLNYTQRSGELRVNVLAPDFAEVETLRENLVAAGLTANLENSSRNGDRVRARLRIGGGA